MKVNYVCKVSCSIIAEAISPEYMHHYSYISAFICTIKNENLCDITHDHYAHPCHKTVTLSFS